MKNLFRKISFDFLILVLMSLLFFNCDQPEEKTGDPVVDSETGYLRIILDSKITESEALITIRRNKDYDSPVECYKKKVNLINNNGIIKTDSIELKQGAYAIHELMILNDTGEVAYAVPMSGDNNDKKLPEVTNPLPVGFTIEVGETADVKLEIAKVDQADPIVLFNNEVLERRIKYEQDVNFTTENYIYSYLYKSEIDSVVKLSLGCDIKALNGIEKCVNLSQLSIDCRYMTGDFQPLTKLASLRDLTINNADFSNSASMDFLGNCSDFERLVITSSQMTNINIICQMTTLITLDLSSNDIKNISDISNLNKLVKLNLAQNELRVGALEAIAKITTLEILDLSNNDISSFVNLEKLTSLKELYLKNTCWGVADPGTKLDPLSNLINLEILRLNENDVYNISQLANLVNLRELNIAKNNIDCISPLVTLMNNKNTAGLNHSLAIYLHNNPIQYGDQDVKNQVTTLQNDPYISLKF